jgi:CDP-glucose 4,6-dehydratase
VKSVVKKSSSSLFQGAYAGRKVFVTGHTGFKGSWLCEWLLGLGAEVTGYSLPPPTQPALFEQLGLAGRLDHQEGDIRDATALAEAVGRAEPDFIFHLAAQSLVRESYRSPVGTYQTNVMGTIHLLEAARALKKRCAVLCVTTDKCYENREWLYGYREEDPLGGHDPYSSSKGAAEIAIAAWRRSFFAGHPARVASARAGNVIGGGDWAADRIVPDCVRALQRSEPVAVRNPHATRPWQHVLEPLSGYLWLAARLYQPSTLNSQLASAFNFGPGHDANRSVRELVEEMLKHWPGHWEDRSQRHAVHEASLLQLATDKAQALLGWSPVWTFPTAIKQTIEWYHRAATSARAAATLTRRQIEQYQKDAVRAGVKWCE